MLISILIPLLLTSLINSSTSTTSSKPYTTTLQIYHRLKQPKIIPEKWYKKVLIRVDLNTDLIWIDSTIVGEGEGEGVGFEDLVGGEGLYQIGVRELGDDDLGKEAGGEVKEEEVKDDDLDHIIAVDSCSILQRPSLPFQESFTFNFLPSPHTDFVGIYYNTNSEIYCKHKKVYGSTEEVLLRGKRGIRGGSEKIGRGIELEVSRGKVPEVIYNKTKPKVLGSDGKIVIPIKEKSFIQKYWIYGAVIFVIFMVTGPEEETKSGTEGGGTEAAAPVPGKK